jgi:exosortase
MPEIRLTKIQQLTSISNPAIALKASAIGVAIVALFYQDLSILFNDALRNEATSHILVIPLLFAYLIYRKRKMLRAVVTFEKGSKPNQTKHLTTISGILLAVISVILYWYSSSLFSPLEYHILIMPIFAAGLALILFNLQTLRQLVFPLAFLAFLTPPPSEILDGLGSTLSVISSEASNAIVNAFGIHSSISSEFGNPTILVIRPDQSTVGFTVDVACSGIYSLMGFLIFAAFIAYITRDRMWKKATIFILGLPFIYLLNIIRITTILLLGYQYGEELALQAFHLIGGWVLIFLGTLLLLTISEKVFRTRVFSKPPPPNFCTRCNSSVLVSTESYCSNCGRLLRTSGAKLRITDLVKIVAIASIITILLSIQAPVIALTKGPAPLIAQTPEGQQGNTQILPQIPTRTLRFVYRDKNFEQISQEDASLVYEYADPNGTDEPVYVGIEVAQAISSLHRWETCLITWPQTHGYQPEVTQLDLKDVQILQNPPIIARYFVFKFTNYNQTEAVLYWYETSVFAYNGTTQQEHVKISLIEYRNSAENITEIENEMMPFAMAIVAYWQPIKTWSQIALFLSSNSSKIALTPIAALIALIIFQTIEDKRKRRQNFTTYLKLSASDKQLIEASKRSKPAPPTIQNMTTVYRKIGNNHMSEEEIREKIYRLEEARVISSQIMSQLDNPTLVWKTNFKQKQTTKPRVATMFTRLRKPRLKSASLEK